MELKARRQIRLEMGIESSDIKFVSEWLSLLFYFFFFPLGERERRNCMVMSM